MPMTATLIIDGFITVPSWTTIAVGGTAGTQEVTITLPGTFIGFITVRVRYSVDADPTVYLDLTTIVDVA